MDQESINYRLLAPQALVGLVDAMSYMVVGPSIVFYVLQAGGTYEQYGIILSAFSFSSFCFKPFLGYWVDKSSEFRAPYLASIAAAALGGLVYFLASLFTGRLAIGLILAGRLMGGMGAANSSLGYTYIAQVIPKNHLTKASAVLSMVRVFGMSTAPGLNVFLDKIHGEIRLRSFHFELTPLNSVGLLLVVGNLLGFFIMYFLLEEPPEATKPSRRASIDHVDERSWKFWKSILSLEILVPMLSIFALNANFQLMETGMAPAANDALGWGPVGVSTLFGVNAVLIFFAIVLTFQLSSRGMTDETLLEIGLGFSTVGYLLMYLLWKNPTTVFWFSLPIVLSTLAFPFMGAPTRSIFTRIVDASPYLKHHQGTMQALLSMIASVAGFTAPGLISAFVLRKPAGVAASRDHREFTPWALFAPLLSALTLVGTLYLRYAKEAIPEEEPAEPSESDSLVGEPRPTYPHFHPKTYAARRNTVCLMGITQVSFHEARISGMRRHSTGIVGLGLLEPMDNSSGNVRRQSSAF